MPIPVYHIKLGASSRFDPSSVTSNGNNNEADVGGHGHNLDDFPPLNNKGSSSPPIASAAGLLSF